MQRQKGELLGSGSDDGIFRISAGHRAAAFRSGPSMRQGKEPAPDPWRSAPVSQMTARRTGYARKRPVRARKWKRRAATVLGLALVVVLYFTPTLFDRYVLPAPPSAGGEGAAARIEAAPSRSDCLRPPADPRPTSCRNRRTRASHLLPTIRADPCTTSSGRTMHRRARTGSSRRPWPQFPPPRDCSSSTTEPPMKGRPKRAKPTSLIGTARSGPPS